MKRIILGLIFLSSIIACNEKKEKKASSVELEEKDTALTSLGLDKVKLPPGFSMSIYAKVPNARSMAWGDNGTLFAGNRDQDKVYAIVDANQDGKADSVFVIDEKLTMPCGVAFRNGSLYVAEVSRILRYDNIESRLSNPPEPVVVFENTLRLVQMENYMFRLERLVMFVKRRIPFMLQLPV
jgi:glucose/arabinose dehydrogenase